MALNPDDVEDQLEEVQLLQMAILKLLLERNITYPTALTSLLGVFFSLCFREMGLGVETVRIFLNKGMREAEDVWGKDPGATYGGGLDG
jgi:hypothetical protein